MIGGSAEDTCLTLGEYEGQMMLNVFPDIEGGEALAQSNSKQSKSQMKKYNLRPRPTIQKSQLKVNTGKKPTDTSFDLNIPIPVQNQPPIKKYTVEVSTFVFSFESELSKIKILVPLLKLLKNLAYKESFQKLLHPTIPTPDVVNLEEERPMIYLGR